MNKLFLSLTLLSAGCLNTFEELYIPENTALTTDAPNLTELASQIRFSAFRAFGYQQDGLDQFAIVLSSSYSPFVCSDDFYTHTNRVELSLLSEQEPAVGDIIPIDQFNGLLSADDFAENYFYLYAAVYENPSPNLEGTFEITELSENALSGVITAHLSGDSLSVLSSDIGFALDEVTFTLNVTSAPSCDYLLFENW